MSTNTENTSPWRHRTGTRRADDLGPEPSSAELLSYADGTVGGTEWERLHRRICDDPILYRRVIELQRAIYARAHFPAKATYVEEMAAFDALTEESVEATPAAVPLTERLVAGVDEFRRWCEQKSAGFVSSIEVAGFGFRVLFGAGTEDVRAETSTTRLYSRSPEDEVENRGRQLKIQCGSDVVRIAMEPQGLRVTVELAARSNGNFLIQEAVATTEGGFTTQRIVGAPVAAIEEGTGTVHVPCPVGRHCLLVQIEEFGAATRQWGIVVERVI